MIMLWVNIVVMVSVCECMLGYHIDCYGRAQPRPVDDDVVDNNMMGEY